MDSRSSPLRALSRGIDVLRAVSQIGPISLTEAIEATGLAHTTVVRIMRTLESGGLVRRIEGTKRYAATEMTLGLSCGFSQDDRLAQAAAGPMRELTARIGWPVALLTRVGGSMVVRDSTVRETSLTFNVYDPGITLPIFTSAAGRAYFAFCDAPARAEMVANATLAHPDTDRHLLEEIGSEAAVARIRALGHVAMSSVGMQDLVRGNAAIAVPLLAGDMAQQVPQGALSLVFFGRAMPLARAVAELVPPLRKAADEIGAALAGQSSTAATRWQRTVRMHVN